MATLGNTPSPSNSPVPAKSQKICDKCEMSGEMDTVYKLWTMPAHFMQYYSIHLKYSGTKENSELSLTPWIEHEISSL